MNFNPYVLIMAVFSLAIGLILYWLSVRGKVPYFQATNLISWLLIALFPVLLIFAFFPDSSFTGTIKGVSMGGAIGAFIFIWWYGTKAAAEAASRERAERIAIVESKAEAEPEKAKPAWDLARVTLEAYFDRNLSQITSIFWLSVSVMVVGFGIIIWGIYQTTTNPPNTFVPAAIASAAGAVTEFIGATFLFIYRSAIQQASSYSKTLERINSVGMAMQILDTMPDEAESDDLKSKTKAALVELLVRQAHEASERAEGNKDEG